MGATGETIEITSGDSLLVDFTVRDTLGAVVNITNYTIRWVVVPYEGSTGTPTILKTVGAGITITDGVNGAFRVQIDPADTTALAGIYFHEAQITSAQLAVYTVSSGRFIITGDSA